MTIHKKSAVILIWNDKRELLLQLRASGDNSFPLHWDFSVGGGIDEGETSAQAAERELKEELGVEAVPEFVVEDVSIYQKWNSSDMLEDSVSIYKARHNGPFVPDLKEVEKVEFFNLDKIKQMMEAGEKFHPEFISCWNKGTVSQAFQD